MADEAFGGFTPAAIQFMADLAMNNDRAWFQPRKATYEALVKAPMAALMTALDDRFRARGIPLRADPVRSPFRIYRDVRFSRDKSPYKTHLGASFPWVEAPSGAAAAPAEEGRHTTGGYFNFQPGEMYVGGGMWMPSRSWLEAFRRAVVGDAAAVHAVLEDPGLVAWFGSARSHEALRRVPRGYPADHQRADLLRWKDVVFGRRLSDADVGSPRLPDLLAEGYATAVPLLRFLAGLG